ncbi:MAG: bifunctional DNA primase/polymerase, partial [Candidatus Methanoperedens sp.]
SVLFPQEQKILERTLRAGRIAGRGHVYFKFTDKVGNWKFHEFGIEILGEGNQVVVPPSIHREGQKYKWQLPEGAYLETFELPELPDQVIEIIKQLKKLDEKIKACRKCFRWIINQSRDAMHGKDGRRLMLATATELKAQKVTLEEFRLYSKKVYGDDYDPRRTADEWKNVDEKKTWKCDTIRLNFPEVLELCKSCFKKSPDIDGTDSEATKKAIEIMTKGDPIGYILDTWNKFHSGDRPFGYVLLCSSVCSSIAASDGLVINFNGDSGGGKSHACRSMLHLIPQKWWIRRSLSDKAIFYSDSVQTDMILFSDDVQMSDDMKMIFKNSVSDFQEQIEHETVNILHKSEVLKIPPRLTWWLTAVDDIGNEEIERHRLKIVIEANEHRLKTISDRLQKRRQKGEEKYPGDYPEVKICRAIFRELKYKKEKVIFDFNLKFKDGLSTDTQNMIFEMLLATALINKYQRQRDDDGTIMAEKEDFKRVVDNFAAVSDTQVSKLTKSELLVARYLKQVGYDVSSNTIQEYFKKSKQWVSWVMNGKNGDGGLLSKMPNVIEEDVIKKDGTESVRKKMYRFVGEWNELAIYEKIAEIID